MQNIRGSELPEASLRWKINKHEIGNSTSLDLVVVIESACMFIPSCCLVDNWVYKGPFSFKHVYFIYLCLYSNPHLSTHWSHIGIQFKRVKNKHLLSLYISVIFYMRDIICLHGPFCWEMVPYEFSLLVLHIKSINGFYLWCMFKKECMNWNEELHTYIGLFKANSF